MLTCLIVAGSLWIGDDTRMFPTQGAFYFIKQRDVIIIYDNAKRTRTASFLIPKNVKGDTIKEVFENCNNAPMVE